MKVKLIEREAFYLAGVNQSGDKGHSNRNDHEGMKSYRDGMEQYKKAKQKHREAMSEHKEAMKAHKEAMKEEAKQNQGFEMPDFETAMNRFGEMMQNFGKHIEKNAKSWDKDLKDFGNNFSDRADDFGEKVGVWADDFGKKMENWGENYGKRMEAWGQEYGKKMGAWGEEYGKKMEEWGRNFEKKMDRWAEDTERKWDDVWEADVTMDRNINDWFERSPLFRSFMEVYNSQLAEQDDLTTSKFFYEVQIMASSVSGQNAMTMLGARTNNLIPVSYPAVNMTYDPDKWVVVKVTEDEFKKDWLSRLEELDLLKGYSMEPYFIIRHRFEPEDKLIKIYCPLKKKEAEDITVEIIEETEDER